jgi:MSHA pilin protein MshA
LSQFGTGDAFNWRDRRSERPHGTESTGNEQENASATAAAGSGAVPGNRILEIEMSNLNIQNAHRQGGFTLIELVIVIVLLGILAAIAVPRFIDLSDEAAQAAVEGVAGSIASGMAINFAGCSANNHSTGDDCVAVSECTLDDAEAVLEGTLDTPRYSVAGGTPSPANNGDSATCTVSDTINGGSADYQLIVAGQ